jgi:hypothetical protein
LPLLLAHCQTYAAPTCRHVAILSAALARLPPAISHCRK